MRRTIYKAGRVILPKPARGTGPLTKEQDVWVFHTGQPLDASATEEVLQQVREERDLRSLGEC